MLRTLYLLAGLVVEFICVPVGLDYCPAILSKCVSAYLHEAAPIMRGTTIHTCIVVVYVMHSKDIYYFLVYGFWTTFQLVGRTPKGVGTILLLIIDRSKSQISNVSNTKYSYSVAHMLHNTYYIHLNKTGGAT